MVTGDCNDPPAGYLSTIHRAPINDPPGSYLTDGGADGELRARDLVRHRQDSPRSRRGGDSPEQKSPAPRGGERTGGSDGTHARGQRVGAEPSAAAAARGGGGGFHRRVAAQLPGRRKKIRTVQMRHVEGESTSHRRVGRGHSGAGLTRGLKHTKSSPVARLSYFFISFFLLRPLLPPSLPIAKYKDCVLISYLRVVGIPWYVHPEKRGFTFVSLARYVNSPVASAAATVHRKDSCDPVYVNAPRKKYK